MAITSESVTRIGEISLVEVVSSLSGTIYYHWYREGAWVGMTTEPRKYFRLEPGDEERIICQDTNDAAYDPVANAPVGYPARRSLFWTQPLLGNVRTFKVQEKKAAGDWTDRATIRAAGWAYSWLSARLDDLTEYTHRVLGVDEAGNEGPPLALDTALVVRRPDGVNFVYVYHVGPNQFAFSEI